MHKASRLILVLLGTGAPLWAADQAPSDTPTEAANPFAEASTLPYQLPRFDAIHDADFEPAFEAAMARQRAEVDAIAGNPEPPTFDNTVVALERSGRMLDRVSAVFTNLNASNTDDELQKLEREIAPRLAEHQDEIRLNRALFARVEAVYRRRAELGLDAEALQLMQRYYTTFVRAGARLADKDRDRLRELNRRIAELGTRFEQNVRAATNEAAVVVDDRRLLAGLSDAQVSTAEEAARARGLQGKWVIALQNTTIQPVLAQLEDRTLRRRIYQASIGRCDGGSADNTAVVAELVRLRAERARLLGYPNHAAYVIEDEAAGTTAAVNRMLGELAAAGTRKAREEAAELQALIDAQARAAHSSPFALQSWDWAYYEERARKRRFGFQAADVPPYFELERVLRDGVFYAAHELYGLTFKERIDLPRYHPDVKIYEAFDADGSPLALLLADLYARQSKQGGAWMDQFVAQSGLRGTRAVVVINLNIPKPTEGDPTLLTFVETTTLFHEFGHALHGMLSKVTYPLLGMAATPPDFVEYPSQFNEMWAREPAVLAHYAHHHRTGAPIPTELMQQVVAAQKFGQGYATTEYAAAALVDQSWHQIGPDQAPPAAGAMPFEKAALRRAGVDLAAVPPRYHSPYFMHIFAGGYDGSYYGYTWSEVLARDTGQWFHRHGGLDRTNGEFFRAKVLSRGRTEEPGRLFEEFYGGPAEIGPLLEYRGLAEPLHNAAPRSHEK